MEDRSAYHMCFMVYKNLKKKTNKNPSYTCVRKFYFPSIIRYFPSPFVLTSK